MRDQLQIDRVEACMSWLQEGEAFTHSQSISFLIDKLGELAVSLSFINNQMAVAKRVLNIKKVEAYHSLIASETANEKYFAPSLAKDFISAKLDKEQYDYDLCERCSRSLTHTIDAIRTAISALKVDQQTQSYTGNIQVRA